MEKIALNGLGGIELKDNLISQFDRDLPWSLDAEQAVIAGLLLQETAFYEVQSKSPLTANSFYKPEHQMIYSAMESIATKEGIPLDEIILMDRLNNQNELEAVGGHLYIGECCSRIENNCHLIHYAKIVNDKYLQRCLISNVKELLEDARKPYDSYKDLQTTTLPQITKLLSLGATENGSSLKTVCTELQAETDRKIKGENTQINDQVLVKWGIHKLDQNLGSLNPKMQDYMIIIGGLPSHGKSAFVRQVVSYNLLKRGKSAVVFLRETGRRSYCAGIASQHSKVDLRQDYRITLQEQKGQIKIKNFQDCLASLESNADEKFFCYEDCVSIDQIIARTKQIYLATGSIDIIVVDYLQLVESKNVNNLRSDEIIGSIVDRLKDLAKSMGAVCFLISSLNREVTPDKIPNLSSLRGSNQVGHGGDRVIFVYRPHKNKAGQEQVGHKNHDIIIAQAKARDGVIGSEVLKFTGKYLNFWDVLDVAPQNKEIEKGVYKGTDGTVIIKK